MEEKDIFINRRIYSNPADIFSVNNEPISSIKDNAIYVIDTNALLLPYTTSSKSIDEIKKVYGQLIEGNKFFIPAQVAREFAKNRPEKIKEIFQQLNRKRSKLKKLYVGKYPLLSESVAYQESLEMEEKIDIAVKEYSSKLDKVLGQIKNWTWDDPVTKAYNSIFTEDIIIEVESSEEQIKSDLRYRYQHKLPPGYKDGGKDDDGIGDLLIWLAILQLTKKLKKHVIFVSGEEKTDWFYKSEGQILYPRFELISEFREKGAKKSFHIIKLSELLELFGADQNIVKELEIEEKISQISTFSLPAKSINVSHNAVYNWFFDSYGNEYKIKVNDSSFPEIVLRKSKEKIGVEILAYTGLQSLTKCIGNSYGRVHFANYTKFIIVVVLPIDVNIESIRRASENVVSSFIMELEFELIFGYLDDKQNFLIYD